MGTLKLICPEEDWILAVRAAKHAPDKLGVYYGCVVAFEHTPGHFYVYRTKTQIVVRRST